MEAHASAMHYQPQRAITLFGDLEKQFPSNLHVLLNIGKLQQELMEYQEALYTFKKARITDEFNLKHMDLYALVLQQRGGPSTLELNKLVHELLAISEQRPEPWVAVALYSKAKGEKEKGLSFLDKALQFDKRHILAYQLRGSLLMSLGRADHAVVAYFQANALHRELASFKGLVEAYLAVPKKKEALCTAKQALQLMPRSASAITLVGQVLAATPEGVEKAKRAFHKALSLDPLSVDAVMALVDLHMHQQDYSACISLLQQSLEHHNKDFVHIKLAEVYSASQQYSEALAYYHTALSLSPGNSIALAGLERLEKLMRGIDPGEDDEGEGDDGDGDLNMESY